MEEARQDWVRKNQERRNEVRARRRQCFKPAPWQPLLHAPSQDGSRPHVSPAPSRSHPPHAPRPPASRPRRQVRELKKRQARDREKEVRRREKRQEKEKAEREAAAKIRMEQEAYELQASEPGARRGRGHLRAAQC